jgi:hypothetical protein
MTSSILNIKVVTIILNDSIIKINKKNMVAQTCKWVPPHYFKVCFIAHKIILPKTSQACSVKT